MQGQKTQTPKPCKCPKCGKRLFDSVSASGVVEIKCPKCKAASRISWG